jgi:thiol-disulfide isomerase/thioredoxin
VLGTGAGVWRRRVDGRLRSAKAPTAATAPAAATETPLSGGVLPRGAVEGASSLSGAESSLRRVESSSEATVTRPVAADPSAAGERIDPDLLRALGVGPAPATLLQFSTAFCAPCRSVRRISSEVAGLLQGVQHVEVDAESHLAAVRALGIWRTPTLLVLDAEGRVVKRATGVPGKPQLIAVLADLLPAR